MDETTDELLAMLRAMRPTANEESLRLFTAGAQYTLVNAEEFRRILSWHQRCAGSVTHGNYDGSTFRGRNSSDLDKKIVSRSGRIAGFPRQSTHVWCLIARMLTKMGYR